MPETVVAQSSLAGGRLAIVARHSGSCLASPSAGQWRVDECLLISRSSLFSRFRKNTRMPAPTSVAATWPIWSILKYRRSWSLMPKARGDPTGHVFGTDAHRSWLANSHEKYARIASGPCAT